MASKERMSELHSGYSSKDASATTWVRARRDLQEAELYWLATVRSDGRPHVTPLLGVWQDDAMYFCTGADERKAKNLAQNRHCILMTGRNTLEGLDIVVEGQAVV